MAMTLTAYNEPYATDQTAQRVYLYGKVVFTSTYVTGGYTVTFPIADASGGTVTLPTINVNPDTAFVYSTNGGTTLFLYAYNKTTNKIQVYTTGTASGDALNELANGAANPTSDVIEFLFEWAKD